MTDDDQSYTDYMKAVGELPMSGAIQRTSLLKRMLPSDLNIFKCKCSVCNNPPEFETFCEVKDWKVVEGVRQVKCKGILPSLGFGEAWMERQLANLAGGPPDKSLYYGTWPNPDPLSFGSVEYTPELTSFFDILKNGVRIKDRPKVTCRGATSFPEYACGIPIEELMPVDFATITDHHTGLTQALADIRQERGDHPLPHLTTHYKVHPDD